jgi:hypothetical protein
MPVSISSKNLVVVQFEKKEKRVHAKAQRRKEDAEGLRGG